MIYVLIGGQIIKSITHTVSEFQNPSCVRVIKFRVELPKNPRSKKLIQILGCSKFGHIESKSDEAYVKLVEIRKRQKLFRSFCM